MFISSQNLKAFFKGDTKYSMRSNLFEGFLIGGWSVFSLPTETKQALPTLIIDEWKGALSYVDWPKSSAKSLWLFPTPDMTFWVFSGCLIPFFLSRLSLFFFSANPLLCDELIRGKMSYAIQQMERYLFFKTLCDWCIEVSYECCFVIKLLQTLSCNKVFKCARKGEFYPSLTYIHMRLSVIG